MQSKGYLIAKAFTSKDMLALNDVVVTVSKPSVDKKEELLAVHITDENGKTDKFSFDILDDTTFVIVTVRAEHPTCKLVVIKNVQIFSDVITIQSLEMEPNECNINLL